MEIEILDIKKETSKRDLEMDGKALQNLYWAGRWATIVAYATYILILIQLIVEIALFSKSEASYGFVMPFNLAVIVVQFLQVQRLHEFEADSAHAYKQNCPYSVNHSFNELSKYLSLSVLFIGLNILSKIIFFIYYLYLNNELF
jgi:hypothetical protein